MNEKTAVELLKIAAQLAHTVASSGGQYKSANCRGSCQVDALYTDCLDVVHKQFSALSTSGQPAKNESA
jgi:hypothetical protein